MSLEMSLYSLLYNTYLCILSTPVIGVSLVVSCLQHRSNHISEIIQNEATI